MAKPGGISAQINMAVTEIWSRFPPEISNWNKRFRKFANTEVSLSKGKKFVLNKVNLGILAILLKGEKSWITTFLKASELSEAELSATFKEMELRFAGKSPAFQTWKGTFVEVLFVKTKKFRDLEGCATEASLNVSLAEIINGETSFYPGGQGTKNLSEVLGFDIGSHEIPWRNEQVSSAVAKISTIKKISAELARLRDSEQHGGAASNNKILSAQAVLDTEIAALRKMVDPKALEVALDMTIDGDLFVDRAVLLRLNSGKRILLVSTEFKNYTTRGAWAQQVKRNPRIFEAKPQAEISYVLEVRMSGALTGFKKINIKAEELHINAATESSDRMLINLTRKSKAIESSIAITPRREVRKALGLRKKDLPKSTAITNVYQIEWQIQDGIEPLLAKLFAAMKDN